MVTRGEVMENHAKLRDMRDYLDLLLNLHETALFQYNIEGTVYFIPQADIDRLIARYQSLKGQLATKYGELL